MTRRVAFRASLLAVGAVAAVAVAASAFASAGPPFPDPVNGQMVYDEAGVLSPNVAADLERRLDAIEAATGAEIVYYLQIDPTKDGESNLDAARALIDQWGIGRAGYDDGFVVLISYQDDLVHGQLSTFGGSGFSAAYLDAAEQQAFREQVIVPHLLNEDPNGAFLAATTYLESVVTPEAAATLNTYRLVNAIVGIPLAIILLLFTIGAAWWSWARQGRDPQVADDESVLMAGPPAGMTPALATVIRDGRATEHTLQTLLVDLAGAGRLQFANLEFAKTVHSDDDPDPLTDPRIELTEPSATDRTPGKIETDALDVLRRRARDGVLSRSRLWGLNDTLRPTLRRYEQEAVRLGWLARLPGTLMVRWAVIGVLEVVLAIGALVLAFALPMSGLLLAGGALGVGGLVTIGFSRAMSQRTRSGAYVNAMLIAYRRTLARTMALARSLEQVAADPVVATLADTPDKALVWGIALGLHDEVSAVLARSLEDVTPDQPRTTYYPVWIGSAPESWSMPNSASFSGGGGLFSSGGIPNLGGMFAVLGTVGTTPPSSSSSSNGSSGSFGGGSSGGGSGGSTGF